MKKLIIILVILLATYAVYAQCSRHKKCCDYDNNCIVVCSLEPCPFDFPREIWQ